ncbi:PstS family phosphate ABC transporter substrate-binding protein [Bradyrhizobium sp. CCBAU 11357]|uniref:PstS family phosphate ABC transporter substrate-binding protein n=1 Tax=Bradyrhizobium sp. CCBAU 11357 TaxID=1630808 RepID=UPI0023047FA3|nr:substrate-binding domain-containing protein [Bradyrhizobium sp. CCBAU 11357]MDA9497311.1 phosphate ABC transporter substrate-binding protein [Bradyrhizobium sp. CCBAU 11357]
MAFLRMMAALLGLCLAGVTAAAAETRRLDIVGTGDGIDVLRAVAASFMQQEGSAQVEIPPSIGSGGGIAAVGSGKAILGRVARRLTEAEAASGIVYKAIARLPSAFIVHPACGVSAVTSAQLVGIYSGRIANWKELGGADMRIRVVRREDQDSTLTVLRASMPGWNDLQITEKSKMATTTQEAIETVRDVQGAIGFGPFSRPLEQGLTVLRVDGHYPTDADYPSSVVLALIYLDTLQDPDALAFLRFAEARKAADVITSLGSLPVKP